MGDLNVFPRANEDERVGGWTFEISFLKAVRLLDISNKPQED